MNIYETVLRGLSRDLASLGVSWALVGGFAVGTRGGSRTTTDVDIVTTVIDDRDAEALIYRFGAIGYEVQTVLEQTDVNRLGTVRLISPYARPAEVLVDIMFGATGIEPEILASATLTIVVAGLTLPVAARGHLLAMKVLAHGEHRPKDAWDIGELLDASDDDDVELAREGMALIEERGYNNSKDLQAEFDRFLAMHANRG